MDILSATEYINAFCVDTEEWLENATDEQKLRCLNVADRTLKREYKDLIIVDEAVYEFANVICIMFSDTNKLQTHGLNTLTINGLGTFDFGSKTVKTPADIKWTDYIPQISRELINEANNIASSNRRVKWTKV